MAGDDPDGTEASVGEDNLTTEDFLDLADRCERMLDHQFETIREIDSKAEYVTRLVVLVLGVLFTGTSILLRFDGVAGTATTPALLSLGAGVLALVLAMLSAIVTYLSSKLRIGFDPSVATVLGRADVTVPRNQHVRTLVGTYGYAMQVNRRVLQENARRFRLALAALATGVIYFSSAAALFLLGLPALLEWVGFGVTTLAVAVVLWFVLTGRYITAPAQT